jgi:hypothetical protein
MKLCALARAEGLDSLDGLTLRDLAARRNAREALDDARKTSERTSERMAAFVRGRS